MIFDNPLLQPSLMNASGIESRLISFKELIFIKPSTTPKQTQKKSIDLERWWKKEKENNEKYQIMKRVLEKETMRFPAALKLKILILECSINKDDKINFKKRKWVF